ncbi:hypothetical protein [Bradyrhizobium sp.]|uniref:hypothetical protein n=1 Tax=Bradyrhizobium sp. TaxID=376 RepID=UPI0023933072|nr:hypothetical protein [Bradyrhizobium sp.]MDE2379399.1 hypothetical protein [Bradyrhizobium sp.]
MKRLIGAVVGALGLATSAAAQVPVAIVEDVQGKVDGVEFMDYVAQGKVIKLAPKATVVLSYMKSCLRETITGGLAVVGTEQSLIHQSEVQRVKVDCDTSATQLSDREAGQSAATTFRSVAPGERADAPTLYGLSPVVEVKGTGTLVVERIDVQGERYTIPIKSEALVRGKFYDFAKARKSLTAGGTYTASLGARKTTFKIDPGAAAGPAPIIGRLVRL